MISINDFGKEAVFDSLPSRILPSSGEIRHLVATLGYRYGSKKGCEQIISCLPHDVGWEEAPSHGKSEEIKTLAVASANFFDRTNSEFGADELYQAGSALIGKRQRLFLDILLSEGFQLKLFSGYRSTAFQSLLFAARFLDGSLFDQMGRYTCLPAAYSDHCAIDGALDIDNSEALSLFLSGLRTPLPFSIYRPFLCHPFITLEPWHWRTFYLGACTFEENVRSLDLYHIAAAENVNALRKYVDPDFDDGVHGKNKLHVFVNGFSNIREGQCIGSRRQSIELSIADAASCLEEKRCMLVSIPHGYTPLMDGRVADADIGAFVFKLTAKSTGVSAYLTPYASVIEGVNSSDQIYRILEQKASLQAGETYFLEKSLVDEWLLVDDSIVCPALYAVPMAGFYRRDDLPALIHMRYDNWLVNNYSGELPPYISSWDLTRQSRAFSPVHYALLLVYIVEFHRDSARFKPLKEHLQGCLGHVLQTLSMRQDCLDLSDYGTIVFYLQAELLDKGVEGIQQLQNWWERVVLPARTEGISQESYIYIGHLARLGRMALDIGADIGGFDAFPCVIDVIKWPNDSMLFFLAACQIVRLRAELGDVEANKGAQHLLQEVVGHPSGVAIGEAGAFEQLECFQSAIPVEGVREIWKLLNLERDEQDVVRERLVAAVGFLGRLQWDDACGLLSTTADFSAGPVSYSLIDRHARIDYGIHSAQAARFVCELNSMLRT